MYPTIPSRIKASTIDLIVVILFEIGLIWLYNFGGFSIANAFLAVGVIAFVIYEPLLVSVRGQTVGHQVVGIRVMDVKSHKNINFLSAFFRFICKFVLGALSVILAFFTPRQQALHDILSNSIVVSVLYSNEKLEGEAVISLKNLEEQVSGGLNRGHVIKILSGVLILAGLLAFHFTSGLGFF